MKNSTKKTFLHYLSERGLKSTLQRNLILDTFLEIDRHIRVDELSQILRAEHRNMGHATVYRTLKLLVEAGIARTLNFGDGFTRFERVTEGEQHDHLVCNVCESVIEFNSEIVGQIKDDIARRHGFQVQTLKLELRGVCSRCQRNADLGGVGRRPDPGRD